MIVVTAMAATMAAMTIMFLLRRRVNMTIWAYILRMPTLEYSFVPTISAKGREGWREGCVSVNFA